MPDSPANSLELCLQSDAGADPLSDAIEYLNLRGWIPGRFELSAPWGIRVESRLGWLYLVLQSQCLVEIDGRTIPVSTGDLIITGQGLSHSVRDAADSRTVAIQSSLEPRHFERREPLVLGGGGETTRLFCGCLLLEGLERSPLRSSLPAVIHIKGKRQQAPPYVDHIMSLLDLEATNQEPCARSVTNRLVRILFLKALQGYMSEPPEAGANWLRALADPCIGRGDQIHARPAGGGVDGGFAGKRSSHGAFDVLGTFRGDGGPAATGVPDGLANAKGLLSAAHGADRIEGSGRPGGLRIRGRVQQGVHTLGRHGPRRLSSRWGCRGFLGASSSPPSIT